MVVARRILSPVLVLIGFCLVAAALYRSFITFSANVDWPVVVLGTAVIVVGLLAQAAPLSRRVIGAAIAIGAVVLFTLGYPLYGMSGIGLVGFTSLLWIPAVALGTAAVLVARGRSWLSLVVVIFVVMVYTVIGLLVGNGPAGWWPVNVRLPGPAMDWLAMTLRAFWPVQVVLIAVIVALGALAGAWIDRVRRGSQTEHGQPDGTMVG